MVIDIIKSNNKAFLFLLLFVGCFNFSHSQEKGLINADTIHNCFLAIMDSPHNYKNLKVVDSLINLKTDISVIKITIQSSETKLSTSYSILFKINDSWAVENENHKYEKNLKDVPEGFENKLDGAQSRNYFATCPTLTQTLIFQRFYYFIILKHHVIKSFEADVSIDVISQISKDWDRDLSLFKLFDKYISKNKLE
ncbi:hypothetical protein ACFGVS_29070 [Mucilaginibacter sp. AW1-7]|uniref:hypothetical protein n=1 Tax=Mucilaginibacter sp. AW1-7 TaxID=3349874 RepID=UPI003F74065B